MSLTTVHVVFHDKQCESLTHVTQCVTEYLVDLYTLPLVKLVAHASHRLVGQLFQDHFGRGFSAGDIEDAMAIACECGSLEILEILHSHAPLLYTTTRFLDAAACHGQMRVIQWLVAHRHETFSMEAIRGATRGGFLTILEFLLENNHFASHSHDCLWCAMEMAIQYGRLEIFEWLLRRQLAVTKDVTTINCIFRKQHAIQTLLQLDRDDACAHASSNAVLEVWFGRIAASSSASGMKVLQWLLQRFPNANITSFGIETMRNAAVKGDVRFVQWLHQTGTSKCTRRAMYEAARNGHLQVLKYILTNLKDAIDLTKPQTNDLLESEDAIAARYGHVDVVRFLHETLGKLPASMEDAARNGHLEVVRYLHQVGHVEITAQAIDNAVMFGQDQVTRYFDDQTHKPCSSEALNHAAGKGFLRIVERFPQICSSTTLEMACCGDHPMSLSLVKFLVARVHLAITSKAICLAAAHGQHAVLEFICQVHVARTNLMNNALGSAVNCQSGRLMSDSNPQHLCCGWLGNAVEEAARCGRFENVRFLLDYFTDSAPSRKLFDHAFALERAIKKGHLETVQLFHAYNLTAFSWRCMDLAAKRGHLAIVKFLHNFRTEGCSVAAMDKASAKGHLRIVRFLHFHRHEGCSTRAMDQAAANGHLAVVRFLHLHRREGCTTRAMDDAATNGFLEIVKFLHEFRKEGCTTAAIDNAATNGLNKMVEFLRSNRTEGYTTRAFARAPVLDPPSQSS